MPADRIVSLVPAATEILFAIGAGDKVKAVSHECDHPPEAAERPTASRTRLDAEGPSRDIDEDVRTAVDEGEPMFEVLGEVLHHVQPDLVVTQEACDVCGITPVDVRAKLARFEPVDQPELVGLHPHTLDDVVDQIRRLGEAAGARERADELAAGLTERIRRVEERAGEGPRPRVAVLDWLDPPMAAGHWIPGMVEAAGGRPCLVTDASPSTYVDPEEIVEAQPDVLVLAPCGFDAERARRELTALQATDAWSQIPAVQEGRVVALDADRYTSRPGPRLVDGLEQLAIAIDPGVDLPTAQAERVHRLR